jgi:hypothetical protein
MSNQNIRIYLLEETVSGQAEIIGLTNEALAIVSERTERRLRQELPALIRGILLRWRAEGKDVSCPIHSEAGSPSASFARVLIQAEPGKHSHQSEEFCICVQVGAIGIAGQKA